MDISFDRKETDYLEDACSGHLKLIISFFLGVLLCIVPVGMIVGVLFAIIAIGLIAVVVVTCHRDILVW
jgi:VIT1/CCC1 family predicted Fe2+/Mn2+ transporter